MPYLPHAEEGGVQGPPLAPCVPPATRISPVWLPSSLLPLPSPPLPLSHFPHTCMSTVRQLASTCGSASTRCIWRSLSSMPERRGEGEKRERG